VNDFECVNKWFGTLDTLLVDIILFLDLDAELHKENNFEVVLLNLLLTPLFAVTFFFGEAIELFWVDELVVVVISLIIRHSSSDDSRLLY